MSENIQSRNGKIKLLIAESNSLEAKRTAAKLADYFTVEKCSIVCVSTARDALEAIKKDPPSIVLLDYYLPDMKGDEALEIIKKERPFMPIVILTMIGSADIAVKLMKLGADDYVSKKYGFVGIGAAIGKALERKKIEIDAQTLRDRLTEELKTRNEQLSEMVNAQTRQLRERNFKISRILKIGEMMSSIRDLDELLAAILKGTSEILQAERASLFIHDPKTGELWLKVSEKREIGEIRFSVNKGIAGHVARTRETMNIEDVYSHELFNPEFDIKTGFKTKNLLCVPMENLQGKLIGVLQVLNKEAVSFIKEDEEVLVMFASLAGVLIENSILEQEYIKNERLAAVGNMASYIIHDIKGPMTSIRGFAEMLGNKSPKNKEFSNIIIRVVDRLTNMAQELLDFAKGIDNTLEWRETSCLDFFSEIFLFIERDMKEKKVKFVPKINYTGKMEINPEKIERVVYNIAGNALDALEEGGEFVVEVSESQDKNHILIILSDNGKGMPDSIIKTLFEPFATYGKSKGTGLGMAITKKIIDAHNGTIKVESEEGKGTRFEVVLPKFQAKLSRM
ncbi:MAG: GAF domain-containing protein [Nitrospinae bacterium]|nr:GAF domain-containing protein [Nitrospinota bacterium]